MAVGDAGIGIRRHLAYNPKYASLSTDEEAIREAIKPGVSGTTEDRGYGFEEILDEAEQLDQASLLIVSGSGRGRIQVINGKRKKFTSDAMAVGFPGTLVQLTMRGQ